MDFWWLVIPGLLLGFYAQSRVGAAYRRYSREANESGLTGAQAARIILDRAGLTQMPIHEIQGHLSDHYDPVRKRLCLSSHNFRSASVAAVGIAAHEAGHALQDQANYAPMNLRMALVPITSFATNASIFLFIGGMFLNLTTFALGGIIIYGIITLFQLVTLPVEFDASSRAKKRLAELGLMGRRDADGVSAVLNAAALTYVAAMVTSALYLLQFILNFAGQSEDHA